MKFMNVLNKQTKALIHSTDLSSSSFYGTSSWVKDAKYAGNVSTDRNFQEQKI